jgi:UTP--glucose-1-phosphate uridylyltransferase
MKVTKAVIPAAGLGTRFLPWTKVIPKEMLPVGDKPAIQYVVEECVLSGIKDIIIVTSYHKRAIEDYFDYLPELERFLKEQGKTDKLKEVRQVAEMANFIFVRQKGPYGNATPVISAQKAVGDEPFAVLWGDQFFVAQPPRLKQCLKVFDHYQTSLVSGIRAQGDEFYKRGICDLGKELAKGIFELKRIVEKPGPEKAPSHLAAYGTYVFTPEIFSQLNQLKPGKNGELWLVDAISSLCRQTEVLAVELKKAQLYDVGNKLNYYKTVFDFVLKDKEVGKEIKQYLRKKLQPS